MGGEKRHRGAGFVMVSDQVMEGFRSQHRDVAAEDQDGPSALLKMRHGLLDRVACAHLRLLKGELHGLPRQGLLHLFGLMAHHQDGFFGADLKGQVRSKKNHGPSQEGM